MKTIACATLGFVTIASPSLTTCDTLIEFLEDVAVTSTRGAYASALITPLMAYLAGRVTIYLNLNEFDRTGKNLMEISSKSII